MRIVTVAALALTVAGAACSLTPVRQDPFPPMPIRADRPAPPPARVVLTPSNIEIKDKVQFEVGSAKLLEVSYPLLDDVARVMIENKQIELVEVAGHTDATGGAKLNRELSRARAQSVREYLVGKGVESVRLTAAGYGPDKPIADNDTPDGRERNRRVEFVILKQGPTKTVVEEE